MARLLTSLALLLLVIGGAAYVCGPELMGLGDEVGMQVHGTVDWSDPGSVALARYNSALGLTLDPLAEIYEAASELGGPNPVLALPTTMRARAVLVEAADLAEEAAAEAPKDLRFLEPLFTDYLDAAAAMLDDWDALRPSVLARKDDLDTVRPLAARIAQTFDAQHEIHGALQDAQEARLLDDLTQHEDDRGYRYYHRLLHYHGFRVTRLVLSSMSTAGRIRGAVTGYLEAEASIRRFVEGRGRIHDEFAPFLEAVERFTEASVALMNQASGFPDEDWVTTTGGAAVLDAFEDLRLERQRLLRLERTGEL